MGAEVPFTLETVRNIVAHMRREDLFENMGHIF
jgi:hypothetical protein